MGLLPWIYACMLDFSLRRSSFSRRVPPPVSMHLLFVASVRPQNPLRLGRYLRDVPHIPITELTHIERSLSRWTRLARCQRLRVPQELRQALLAYQLCLRGREETSRLGV